MYYSDYHPRRTDKHGERDGGVCYVPYHAKIYHANESTDDVVKEDNIYQS